MLDVDEERTASQDARVWASEPADVPENERILAMAAHASGALVSFVGPLAILLLAPRVGALTSPSAWFRDGVTRALEYQMVVFVLWVLTFPLAFIPVIGWIPNALVLVVNAILSFIAAVHAYDSRLFRYPVGVRLFGREGRSG